MREVNMKRIIAVVLLSALAVGCGESKAEERERRTQEIIDAMHNP